MAFDGDTPSEVVGDDRPDFDPAVADQLTTMIVTTAQRNLQLNGATARNQLAASSAVLTLGVQQINAGTLRQLTRLTPLEAHSAGELRKAGDPQYFAILSTGSRVPGSGRVAGKQPAAAGQRR